MNYLWHIVILICIYSVLASSLNLITGRTGLVSLCHAAFYGIGAYTATLLMLDGHCSFSSALLLSVALTTVVSLCVGWPALRLRGDYFILATLGFQVIFFALLYNWVGLTNGPYGITAIPVPTIVGVCLDTPLLYLLFTFTICAVCWLALRRLSESPFGRLLTAIREDETAVQALGKNTDLSKLLAFALSAAIAAIPGCLFAGYARYIDPTGFTIAESVFIFAVMVIGGAGSAWGPVVGAVFLVLVPEAIRFLHCPDSIAAYLRQFVYGACIVVLMRFRPQGILGEYDFD